MDFLASVSASLSGSGWTPSSFLQQVYTTIHQYVTNHLRNIARFLGHLFATDFVSWKINEDDMTSSSRIFIKIIMHEMMEGIKTLVERFKDPEVKRGCEGMFGCAEEY